MFPKFKRKGQGQMRFSLLQKKIFFNMLHYILLIRKIKRLFKCQLSVRCFYTKMFSKWKQQSAFQTALELPGVTRESVKAQRSMFAGKTCSLYSLCELKRKACLKTALQQSAGSEKWISYQPFFRLQNDIHVGSSFNVASQSFHKNSFRCIHTERASRGLQPKETFPL